LPSRADFLEAGIRAVQVPAAAASIGKAVPEHCECQGPQVLFDVRQTGHLANQLRGLGQVLALSDLKHGDVVEGAGQTHRSETGKKFGAVHGRPLTVLVLQPESSGHPDQADIAVEPRLQEVIQRFSGQGVEVHLALVQHPLDHFEVVLLLMARAPRHREQSFGQSIHGDPPPVHVRPARTESTAVCRWGGSCNAFPGRQRWV
jgi:hypothetical protein